MKQLDTFFTFVVFGLLGLGAVLTYQRYNPPKDQQSTTQTCIHSKTYKPGEYGNEREFIEIVACGPVEYRPTPSPQH